MMRSHYPPPQALGSVSGLKNAVGKEAAFLGHEQADCRELRASQTQSEAWAGAGEFGTDLMMKITSMSCMLSAHRCL